jgi:CRISPR-associated protein Cmr3
MSKDNMTCFETPMCALRMDPLDPMFFRDGRPFGAASRGSSRQPMPQTLAGMVKTRVLRRIGLDPSRIHNLRQQPVDTKHRWFAFIAVRGPWLAEFDKDGNVVDVFVSTPAFVMKEGKGDDGEIQLLQPLQKDLLPGWDHKDLNPLWTNSDKDLKPAGGYVGRVGLEAILNGNRPCREHIIKEDDLFGYEDRVGIGVDSAKGTTGDGQIYAVRFMRLRERREKGADGHRLGFYAEIGIDPDACEHQDDKRLCEKELEQAREKLVEIFNTEDALPFGGEGRRVHVATIKKAFEWPVAPEPKDGEGFTTILITPTLCPPIPENDPDCCPPPGGPLGKMIAAAIPNPVPVSGWEMTRRENGEYGSTAAKPGCPKPTRFALPAGTTYFWQAGKNGSGEAANTPCFQLARKPQDRQAGWGMALRGVWKWWELKEGNE